MTPEIDSIVHAIESATDSAYPMVAVYDGETRALLSQREIIRVYLENRKLIVRTDRGGFVARGTLAEMESKLNRSRFLRISRSEIINLYKVSNFNFSLLGTILKEMGLHPLFLTSYPNTVLENTINPSRFS